ncbi:uncharacterized protein OCT59_011441 [Rhizophagus irregularis]|uniref:uncharacterized protein n=1 Tax=Rhizophagus irregularis TaxID=588596 RepID=UPI003330151F|nr:hypothetical protein OCT59_011441 [Rhizophagus irregularis]
MNLSELKCNSNHTELFNQLIPICHNIQSLDIIFKCNVSKDLKDLISSQNCLKHLSLIQPYYKYFNELQYYIKFTQLQILKFDYACPKVESLITFLEINGNNLKELYLYKCNNLLNLSIAIFCPNLKSLFTLFMKNELETLKLILINCQQLESIKIWCGSNYLKENDMLEIIVKNSSKNFHELNLYNYVKSDLLSKDLESFFISWKDRIPSKSITFIVIKGFGGSLDTNNENMKIIEKYKKFGIIKKFLVEKKKIFCR